MHDNEMTLCRSFDSGSDGRVCCSVRRRGYCSNMAKEEGKLVIKTVEMHTGGEPVRIVVSGESN